MLLAACIYKKPNLAESSKHQACIYTSHNTCNCSCACPNLYILGEGVVIRKAQLTCWWPSQVIFYIELSPNVKVALPLRRQQNGMQLLGPAYQAHGDLQLATSSPQLSTYNMTLHINCGVCSCNLYHLFSNAALHPPQATARLCNINSGMIVSTLYYSL